MTPVHLPISTRASARSSRAFRPRAFERMTSRTRSAMEDQKLNVFAGLITLSGAIGRPMAGP